MLERFGFNFGPPQLPPQPPQPPYLRGYPYARPQYAPPSWGPMPTNQPLPFWDSLGDNDPNRMLDRGYGVYGDADGFSFLDQSGIDWNNQRWTEASRYANQAAAFEQARRDRASSADAARLAGQAPSPGGVPGSWERSVTPSQRPMMNEAFVRRQSPARQVPPADTAPMYRSARPSETRSSAPMPRFGEVFQSRPPQMGGSWERNLG